MCIQWNHANDTSLLLDTAGFLTAFADREAYCKRGIARLSKLMYVQTTSISCQEARIEVVFCSMIFSTRHAPQSMYSGAMVRIQNFGFVGVRRGIPRLRNSLPSLSLRRACPDGTGFLSAFGRSPPAPVLPSDRTELVHFLRWFWIRVVR